MEENVVKLETPLLLPGVESDRDGCLERLEAALKNQPGIRRAHLERDRLPVVLCLHFDPDSLNLVDVRRLAARAGGKIANRFRHKVLPVEGMDCSDCALVVEHSLARMEGVLNVRVHYAAQTIQVEYDSRQVSRQAIEKRVADLGYRVPAGRVRSWFSENRELIFSLLAGLALLAGWLGERTAGTPAILALGAYALVYALGGYDVVRHALGSLRARYLNADVLMVVAAASAAALGEFTEGGLLLFLFSLGHALEDRTLERARRAIRALGSLTPKTALVRRGEEEVEVPVETLEIGEVILVRPGVRVPVDGEVISGRSAVDQSPVTGESLPVEIGVGGRVLAGSINGAGALQVRSTRLARDSTLARAARMVERAHAQKSPSQRAAENFTRVFVPAVLLASLALALILPLLGVPFREASLRAATLLVATSPCALALGAPAAVLAGIARAAGKGILVKGGAHLENLGRLEAIAFDKTGTLTLGSPRVAQIHCLRPSWSESELLRLAAAIESRSAHPLAQALVVEARRRGLELPTVEAVEEIPGQGITAKVAGAEVRIGNSKLLEGWPFPAAAQSAGVGMEANGEIPLFIGCEGQVVGVISVADPLRPGVRAILAALERSGIRRTILLTGDQPAVAASVARQAGLSEYRAGLMPEEKVEALRALASEHAFVGMVGDGVNDAPALAVATVGIAMGGAATDAALEAADVALMANDLSALPFALGLGQAAHAIIRQNLAIAAGTILALGSLALAGLAGIGLAIFVHEGSTLLVVLNALRLLRYRSKLVV